MDWERRGHISLYSLDEDWLEKSIQAAQEHRLTGADGFFVAVAKEFSLSLKTIDKEMLERFSEASLP